MSLQKLTREIISISVAQTWHQAKSEWKLHSTQVTKASFSCLCGHYPIHNLCVIINKHNGYKVVVGNCCVKKFLGLPSGRIFDALKRVKADNNRSLNLGTLQIAYEQNWISLKEYIFYRSIYKRRSRLSPKQLAWKIAINQKVISISGI